MSLKKIHKQELTLVFSYNFLQLITYKTIALASKIAAYRVELFDFKKKKKLNSKSFKLRLEWQTGICCVKNEAIDCFDFIMFG